MYQIKVEGMTCGGCVNSIKKALNAMDPEAKVVVDLKNQTVQVETRKDETHITTAIEDAGYTVLRSERIAS